MVLWKVEGRLTDATFTVKQTSWSCHKNLLYEVRSNTVNIRVAIELTIEMLVHYQIEARVCGRYRETKYDISGRRVTQDGELHKRTK
jgi:hypothetical protein